MYDIRNADMVLLHLAAAAPPTFFILKSYVLCNRVCLDPGKYSQLEKGKYSLSEVPNGVF
jgi:hypothetical protein